MVLSTPEELASVFGYSPVGIRELLFEKGIGTIPIECFPLKERERLRKEFGDGVKDLVDFEGFVEIVKHSKNENGEKARAMLRAYKYSQGNK